MTLLTRASSVTDRNAPATALNDHSEHTMTIKTSIADGIATIEIARPHKKNALTLAMYELMTDAVRAAMVGHTVRALLITGQEGVFTSGNDLEDFMQRPPTGKDSPVFRFMQALADCEKPVIAAVTGVAVGIGATLLLHCDLVYLSEDAHLAMPFVALGLVPEFASSLLMPQLLGRAKAAEKLLLGEPITATEAVEFGIANAVLPAADVLPHARRMALRFNQLSPGAVRDTKRLMRSSSKDGVNRAMHEEAEIFAKRLKTPEAQEAFAAFLSKRKPDFRKF
jgi:enoyl-CoA hydratase/carnithine racemase